MHLCQNLIHIIICTLFRNSNPQFVYNILAHGKTGGMRSILHIRESIQYASETAGIQIHRIDYSQSALAILFNQLIQRGRIVIADNRSQLAGNVIIIQQINSFTGSKSQINLLCILTTNQFNLNTNLFTGNLVDRFGNFITVICISRTDTPYNQLHDLTIICSAAGIPGTFASA